MKTSLSQTPRLFVAYAPRAGLRCAVAYLASRTDVYGWVVAPADGGWRSTYFVLEDYYAPGKTRPTFVAEDELHSGVIEEARSHELASLRDLMEHEWIFRRGDPAAAPEIEAYSRAELAAGDVGVRFARLGRLSNVHATWTYYSPAFEDGVLECLNGHFELDRRAA